MKLPDSWCALHFACMECHLEVVNQLLKHGANPNIPNNQQRTALHISTIKGSFDICKLLIQHGANVNAIDEQSNTCLHYATFHGQIEIVYPLIYTERWVIWYKIMLTWASVTSRGSWLRTWHLKPHWRTSRSSWLGKTHTVDRVSGSWGWYQVVRIMWWSYYDRVRLISLNAHRVWYNNANRLRRCLVLDG